MGGSGSGWCRKRKIPVEYCIVLDSAEWAASCFDLPDLSSWSRRSHGIRPIGVHYCPIGRVRNEPAMRIESLLGYGRELSPEQIICFETSRSSFGNVRWWFSCPRCRRRVAKLYLPPQPAEPEFACRQCHQLTYRSVQQHQRFRIPVGLAELILERLKFTTSASKKNLKTNERAISLRSSMRTSCLRCCKNCDKPLVQELHVREIRCVGLRRRIP